MKRCFMRFPGGHSRAVTFSLDDGVQQDIRFIGLLKKYNLYGTFNLNSARFISREHRYPEGTVWRAMVEDDVTPTYSDPHCGVACHSAHHPTLLNAGEAEIADELLSDRMALEQRFGRPITGLAIPNGPYDETSIKVGKLCGLTYMRAASSSYGYEFPQELCPFQPTAHFLDEKLPFIANEFLEKPCIENPYLLYIWGHTYNLDEHEDAWERVEALMKQISNKDNVWYATDEEIFAYSQKFALLEKSVDGHRIYNPTDTTLWIGFGGPTVWNPTPETVIAIAPGEEKVI